MTPEEIVITKNQKGRYMLQYFIDEVAPESSVATVSKNILLEVIEEFNRKNPDFAIKVEEANKR